MEKYVLIVAGGKGLRMGSDLPKQFIPVEGKPVLMHTLEAFYRWDPSAGLILVLPEDHQPYWKMLCKEIGCKIPHQIATGGETRFHSVRNGLQFLSDEIEQRLGCTSELTEDIWVGVHDGVRPFVSSEMITACFDGAIETGAAIPVVPVIDSIREKDREGSHPVDRSRFMAVQTPQIFSYSLLRAAYAQPFSSLFTDDASVVEAIGKKVGTVAGDPQNIKITTPFDLLIARSLLVNESFS